MAVTISDMLTRASNVSRPELISLALRLLFEGLGSSR